MEALKAKYDPEDFENGWFAWQYALYKNVPDAEKLTKISGINTLFLRSCPNPEALKLLLNEDNRARFMMYSPHISLQEYTQCYGRDYGCHWDSKELEFSGVCFSYYPTIKMLQGKRIAAFPRNYLVRYRGHKLYSDWLIYELFDWKIRAIII